ncbi:MAG TPA: helix-turn-helix domain-containing protein [Candidatus Paceibacterota bacterium]|nr:helix-turn-helix domain-containing protein [Candidatus Paceibacterota bacterium]
MEKSLQKMFDHGEGAFSNERFVTRNKAPYDSFFFSLKEIADYMGVSRAAVLKWVKQGGLRADRAGQAYFVSLGELERYLQREVDVKKIVINRSWME